MRILVLSPNLIGRYNWGHQRFRNDIAKFHDVVFYGSGFPNFDPKKRVMDVINEYGNNFDFVFTCGLRYTLEFNGLEDVKHIPKVHFVVDYFPKHPSGYKGSWPRQHEFMKKNKFDLFFVRQYRQVEDLKKNGINVPSYFLPFSSDMEVYKRLGLEKVFDVITSSTQRSDVYPNRSKINKMLSKTKLKVYMRRVTHQAYINAINRSSIAVISNNIFGSFNMKYSEFLGCGTFVLADRPPDLERIGLEDGKHLVIYSDLIDLRNKIFYYLEHEKERTKIAKEGNKFAQQYLSNDYRIKEMTKIIKKELF